MKKTRKATKSAATTAATTAAKKPTAKKAAVKKSPAKKAVAKALPPKKLPVKKTADKKAAKTAKKSHSGATLAKVHATPSKLIDARIQELGDWRGDMLGRLRALIKQADPDVVEEWKWRGVPVWEHAGMICTGESYKTTVKLTFAKGASLQDPARLFNSSMEGNTRRAIDVHEGDTVNEKAFKALIRDAIALNTAGKKAKAA